MIATMAILSALTMRSTASLAENAVVPPQNLGFFWHAEPQKTKSVSFSDLDGNALELGDFAGKIVVLNFWATWCAPCIREMPGLDNLQAAFNPNDLVVIALSQDRAGRDKIDPFIERTGLQHLIVTVDQKMTVGRTLKLQGLPTTLVFDSRGRELGRFSGPTEWDSADMVNFFKALVAVEPVS